MTALRSRRMLLLSLLALALLPACTTKGTIKATTDPTTDILSSTSGRSWFTEDGLVREDARVTAFTAINFENLKQDMAQGRGEYLASFSALIGVPTERQAEFGRLTREKYGVLFQTARTTPDEMLAALAKEMALRPELTASKPS